MTDQEDKVIYQAIHRSGDGTEPTTDSKAMLEHWSSVIFDAWRPHHNDKEGGVLIMAPISPTTARCLWLTHDAFLKALVAKGVPNTPPCNRPAIDAIGSSSGNPGDVMWVILEDRAARTTRVWSVEWPVEIPAPMTTSGGET